MRLKGKVAIVTGASGGIGRGVAICLAEEGADVLVNHNNDPDKASQVVSEIQKLGRRTMAYSADVSKRDQVDGMIQTAVSELGGIDILVNAAGEYTRAEFLNTSEEMWEQVMAVHLEGAFNCAQAAAKEMVKRNKGGRIIFISSVASLMPFHEASAFGSAKAALNTIAQVASVELGAYGITVNAVAPGWIKTEASAPLLSQAEQLAYINAGIPLGKIGAPEDVGKLCAFLASDDASYINGAIIKVDGGYTITKSEGGSPYPPK